MTGATFCGRPVAGDRALIMAIVNRTTDSFYAPARHADARRAVRQRRRDAELDQWPRGVAGVTTLSNGQIVLILDMKELLSDLNAHIERDSGARNFRAIELSA